ncbi:hypothetical protein [Oligoflexus tunisiensis]|uniref:hypothetical protein n=1 Tax=Oligoflexus tunisiensis TaxID=708132 RepID=UPI00114CC0D6|nr:hypothetical protein [Oligoflexus tunisiensis]
MNEVTKLNQARNGVHLTSASAISSSNRTFGLFFASFFAILTALNYRSSSRLNLPILALSVLFAITGLMIPKFLSPLNQAWTKFGLAIHRVVSPITMLIIYYGGITPIGLMMRLAKKSSITKNFDKTARTYWVDRVSRGPSPETMKYPF